jgi:hypothetical protein
MWEKKKTSPWHPEVSLRPSVSLQAFP